MKKIKLTRGYSAVVDDDDYEIVSCHKWYALIGKMADSGVSVYAARSQHINGSRRTVLMHRVLTNSPDGIDVDHIDGDGLNNTRVNLRPCTKAQNQFNQRPRGGSSNHKGVSWNKTKNKWQAYINIGGKTRYLGRFDSEEDAARAYNNAAMKCFGEFARVNVIN